MWFSFGLFLHTVIWIMWLELPPVVDGRNFTFVSTRSIVNPQYFKDFTLEVVNGNLNAGMLVPKTIQPGFYIYIDFQLRLKNSKKYQSLFNYDVDICKLLDSVKSSIFKKWFLSFRKNGNFTATCPVPPGYYYMHDWNMDQQHIPAYMQSGDFRMVTRFYYGRVKTTKMQIMVEAVIDARLE